jgi:hypothetical protein
MHRFTARRQCTILVLCLAPLVVSPRSAAQDGTSAVPAVPGLPADPVAGKTYPLRVDGSNRGVLLTVHSAARVGRYGTRTALDGRALLVLDTEWENTIPFTFVREQKTAQPTMYKIPDLADHLYLLLDGQRVARISEVAETLIGHVPLKDFALDRIGSRLRGNVVFEVPAAGPVGAAELRFYDFAHGHIVMPLYLDGAKPTELKPVAALLKNEVVEAGVFGFAKQPALDGQTAPEGMTFVVADLRARSLFTFDGDASAFNPKATPGSKMRVGTVADWTEAHRFLQLVVDGERAYSPILPGTTLPDAPRFLPDVYTGGRVVFLAPSDAKSLEVRCDFPNAKPPGGGGYLRPKGITLTLEGKRPALPQHKPIASVDDDVFKVAVVAQAVAQRFGGVAAPEGRKFLVLDVVVNNVGKQGELFQTSEQLKYAPQDDSAPVDVDTATFNGKYRPAPLVFIPPGERRTFQVAFAVAAAEARPRLAYGGVSVAKVLDLQPLDAPGVAPASP